MKAKTSVILRISVSAALVSFLIWSMRGHLPRILGTLADTNTILFFLAVFIFIANITVLSVRLKLLFKGEGLKIPYRRVLQLSYIGYFFNNFMPTAVGGDIVKVYYARKETGQTAKSAISVFMDRFVGLFTFVLIATGALFISWETVPDKIKQVVLGFAIVCLTGIAIMANGAIAEFVLKIFSRLKLWNVGELLSKVYRAIREYRNRKWLILTVIGVSLCSQTIYFIIVFLLAKAVGSDIPLKSVFLIMPIVSVISMLPSLGGLGLREGAIVALFGPFMGKDTAFSMSILLLATLLIASLLGSIVYMLAPQFRISGKALSSMESGEG